MRIGQKLSRKLSWVSAVTAAIVGWTLAISAIASTGGAGAAKLVNNHPAEIAQLGPVVRANPAMTLNITVVLGIHDQAKLDRLLAEQQNPSSSQYHHWLKPAQCRRAP
jgi:subtilase family serine protease